MSTVLPDRIMESSFCAWWLCNGDNKDDNNDDGRGDNSKIMMMTAASMEVGIYTK